MIEKAVDEDALDLGFSVLHAHIRLMTVLLIISYRMKLKKYRVHLYLFYENKH